MDTRIKEQISSELAEYHKSRVAQGYQDHNRPYIPYGTSGFRGKAFEIDHLLYKVGLISGFICSKQSGNVGVMVTASHNPIEDNGVKMINSAGEMLSPDWEETVEKFCNIHDSTEILKFLDIIVTQDALDFNSMSLEFKVHIGCDTRSSSETFVDLVKRGIKTLKPLIDYVDHGTVTTPALHYIVALSNRSDSTPIVDHYYDQLATGLVQIFEQKSDSPRYSGESLVIDCANGVGTCTFNGLFNKQHVRDHLNVTSINTDIYGFGLNHLCGADYVKTHQKPPTNAKDPTKRYASLDGDADRVVYFYLNYVDTEDIKLHLLDGDKIMALFAHYMKDTLKRSGLHEELSLGIVQTAYANGASTNYMRSALGLQVDFTDTGVKNLHRKAIEYDLGIYFEANGHGTIWISKKARQLVEERKVEEMTRLFAIVNCFTGDAVSDILVVETILRIYDWDIRTWDKLYRDRPNSLIKVEIKDRSVIKTTNAGQTCIQPAGLQSKIDEIILAFGSNARSFVRPSGTENVVRVYAEADDQASADKLAKLVGEETSRFCNSL